LPENFEVDAREFREAASKLTKAGFEKAAGRTVAWALRRSANLVRRNVRAFAKPHRRTGKMADKVRTRFTGAGMDFVAGVKATGAGSNLIVGGVRPHRIAPGKLMPLWAGKGKRAAVIGFARVVEHPGFEADPFVHKGIEASKPEIGDIFRKSAETMTSELAYRMRGKG
jgi:hypothetical protein